MAQKYLNLGQATKTDEVSPTLSATELQTLLGLLREDVTENETLETIYAGFQHYCNRTDSFKVGCALALLIQLPDLLSNPTQQLATITLLHELYEWDQAICHPFSRIFIALLESESNDEPKDSRTNFHQTCTDQLKVSLSMKQFLCQLITNPNRDVLKKTARQILNSEPTIKNHEIISVVKSLSDGLVEPPATARSALSVILNDPDGKDSFDSEYEVCEELLTGTHPFVEQTFSPHFLRLAPPMFPVEDELVWLNPVTTNVKIIYDKTLCCPVNGGIEAKRLMAKAFKVALTKPQTQHLVSELKKDSQLVHHSGLTPSKLPELVENNPLVAIALLLKLMQSSQITEYFSVLVNMEISLHSMEVVNRLTTAVDLPQEFVQLYILNCISTCETITDKYLQSRLVRLVCVFLQSLIRNKIINVQELVLEVQDFCINFRNTPEAVGLYTLLKQLQTGDQSTVPTTSTNKQ